MATETLTAEQALGEVLNRVFGGWPPFGWRDRLALSYEAEEPDGAQIFASSAYTVGDLRRWAAPLLDKEEG